jgi:AcrR family transcriptional regulator
MVPSRVRPRAPEVSRNGNGGVTANRSRRQGAHVIEMQRRRLLSGLVEVVGEGGLEAAGVGAICKRAGMSRRTFYEIFEDREACLLAALDTAIDRIAQSVLPVYERERTWSIRVRACLMVLLEHFDAEPGVARLCVIETPKAGPEVLERRKHALDALTSAVDEGRAESKQERALSPVAAQCVVGGALSVIHARLLGDEPRPLVELVNPLMGMIVHPYLGPTAVRRELERPSQSTQGTVARGGSDPFKGLSIRFTYRTALVLSTIATAPGASNRHIAGTSGITDEGQMSRLLTRLQRAGLIENHGDGQPKGEPNAWTLTEQGHAVQAAIGGRE